MNIDMIQTQMVSQETFQWLQGKYRAVDSRDHAAYAEFLADDCVLQFGNNPLAVGQDCLLQGIDNFWHQIHGLNHRFRNVLGTDSFLALEALIDYTRLDDRVVQIPCVTLIERNDQGRARAIRIFLDTTPVFA